MSKRRIIGALTAVVAAVVALVALNPAGASAAGAVGDNAWPVVSRAQYNQMFPNHSSFYTYDSLVTAMAVYPAFTKTGTTNARKLEAAAFLANVGHETGSLVYIVEQNRDAQMLSLLKLDLPAEDAVKLRSIRHFNGLPIDARSVSDEFVLQEGI